MTPGRGSDSLRAVLLGARTGSGSDSKPGSSAVTWHSLRSAAAKDNNKDPPGHYFPVKLAMSTALIKIFFSILMVGLGGLALLMEAPLSSLGSGIWVGIVVGVSGFLGVCAARRPYAQVYVVSFMSVSILSMAASGLLVVLSATSWARASRPQEYVLYDKETDSEVELFGEVLLNNPSILVSGFLVVLGILDILTSLACVALSAREACGASADTMGVFTVHEGHDKKERLYKWLGQQKNIFQVSTTTHPESKPTVRPLISSSGEENSPRGKLKSSPLVHTSEQPLLRPVLIHQKRFQPVSSLNSSGSSGKNQRTTKAIPASGKNNNKNNKTPAVFFLQPDIPKGRGRGGPGPKTKHNKKMVAASGLYSLPPLVESNYFVNRPPGLQSSGIYAPIYQPHHPQGDIYNHLPPPGGYHSLPCPQHPYRQQLGPPPHLYYVPPMRHYMGVEERCLTLAGDRRRTETSASDLEKLKRRRDRKKARREEREKRRNQPLTDEQIDNSYTGLDREIAEGFISLTMEPAVSHRKRYDNGRNSF